MRCGTGINRSWVPFCLTPIFDGPRWVRTFFGTCVTWVAPSEYVESRESKPNRCTVVQSSIRIRFFVWIRVAKFLRQWVVLRLVDTVQTSFKGRWLHFEAPGEGYWWSLMIFLSHPLIQHDPATSNPCDFLFTHLGKAHEPPDALFRYFMIFTYIRGPTVTSWNIFCGEVPGPNSAWNTSFWISYHVINMFHVALIRIDKVHSFFTK